MPTVDFADLLIAYEFASAEDLDERAGRLLPQQGRLRKIPRAAGEKRTAGALVQVSGRGDGGSTAQWCEDNDLQASS